MHHLSRLISAGGLALFACLYPFLARSLTMGGPAQVVVFHIAYALTLLTLAMGLITAPRWFEAVFKLWKTVPVRFLLLLLNLFVVSVVFLAICTQWGVLAWLLMGSLAGISLHGLGAKKRFLVLDQVIRKSWISFVLVYLGFGFGELYFRLHPQWVGGGGGGNPALKAIYKDLYSSNSYGLRDREFPRLPPANSYRVLMLGDSFTFGSGVRLEETFPQQTEQLLSARGNETVFEVINAGQRGLNTLEELHYLKAEGCAFKPDLVLVQFYANDIQETVERQDVKRKRFIEIFFKEPFRKSYLSFYLRRRFDEIVHALITRVDEEIPQDYLWGLHQLTTYDSVAWRQCSGAFIELAAFCKAKQLPLAVVLFPHPGDPHPAIPLIHATVGDLCRKQGLPVLDLLEAVKVIPPDRQMVLPFDHHPSAEYHALAARLLVEALDRWQLLPM